MSAPGETPQRGLVTLYLAAAAPVNARPPSAAPRMERLKNSCALSRSEFPCYAAAPAGGQRTRSAARLTGALTARVRARRPTPAARPL